MTVTTVVTGSGGVDLTGTGYRPEGDVVIDGRPLGDAGGDAAVADEVRFVLAGGSLANDALLREDGGMWTVQVTPPRPAFLVAEAKLGVTEARRARSERVGEVPFTSKRQLMSTLEADGGREGRIDVVTKGAPDVLLAAAPTRGSVARSGALTDARRAEIAADVERLADLALRTLAVAYRPLPDVEPPAPSPSSGDVSESRERSRASSPTWAWSASSIRPGPRAHMAIAEAQRAGDHDDHRRPSPDRGPHRASARHRRRSGRGASVPGATATEDRHAPGADEQPGHDQDDAQDQLTLDELHDPHHDEDGCDYPQQGCTHGATHTPRRPTRSPFGLRWSDHGGAQTEPGVPGCSAARIAATIASGLVGVPSETVSIVRSATAPKRSARRASSSATAAASRRRRR